MKHQLLAIVLLLLAPLIRAAELTVGWRMPVESFAPAFPAGEGLRKLDKPPGESAFFMPGDELWDVSEVCKWPFPKDAEKPKVHPVQAPLPTEAKAWQGAWLVWNARSGMFVARGSWIDILAAQERLNFTHQPFGIRTTLELERAGKPLRSLSVLSRSGKKAAMETEDMDLEMEVSASEDGTIGDLKIYTSWSGDKDGTLWEFDGYVITRDGSRQLLACQGSGDTAWKLFVTTRCEGLGRIPRSDARWIESAGKLLPWEGPGYQEDFVSRPLDAGLYVASFPMNGEFIHQEWPGLELPVVEVPEALQADAKGPLVYLREWFKSFGLLVSPDFFAGFDLASSRILVIGQAAEVDFCEVRFGKRDCGPSGSTWVSTNEASGAWGMSVLPGCNTRLAHRDESEEVDLLFELEPSFHAIGLTDLRLKADIVSGDASVGRIEAAPALEMGKPVEVARRTTAKGEALPLEVTATKVPFKH